MQLYHCIGTVAHGRIAMLLDVDVAQHHDLDLLHGRADAHHPFLLHLSVELVQKVEVDAH